jgi:ParB family chromosome partitioning protein
MNFTPEEIQLVPVQLIRVVNPRVRDKRRFDRIVENIQKVGLKRPITLTPCPDAKPGEPSFDLVCGQGRLEAFVALGQTHIPALVRGYDRQHTLLASLVENIARRRVRAIDQIQAIRWMHENGQTNEEIGRKTGLGDQYVADLIVLLKKGEERLLDAALHERIPITIAMKIAESSDENTQQILMQAYERKEITQKTLGSFREIVQHRKTFGRTLSTDRGKARHRNSVDDFVASYRAQAGRQRLLIKKARACEARLLSITAAFRVLLADEDFANLLRAEKIGTLPRFLAERIKENEL